MCEKTERLYREMDHLQRLKRRICELMEDTTLCCLVKNSEVVESKTNHVNNKGVRHERQDFKRF